MTNRVDRLVHKGLVERQPDPGRPARRPGRPDLTRTHRSRRSARRPARRRAEAARGPVTRRDREHHLGPAQASLPFDH
ncbi:hypothetical protein [Aeromicrobium sp. UC242_57]|uniref:hypothetical protein n=1 Tax=Aeromicrobium sp. UC242_57 TaxID=3374624 RepID=UPI0037A78193